MSTRLKSSKWQIETFLGTARTVDSPVLESGSEKVQRFIFSRCDRRTGSRFWGILLVVACFAVSGCNTVVQGKAQRFPPRSHRVEKSLTWNGLVLRLPPKWKATATESLTWESTEDSNCRAELIPVQFRLEDGSRNELESIASFLGCRKDELYQRRGFFGAEIFYTESRERKDSTIVLTRSLVRCDGEYFKHNARYPYGASIEKVRGAELWMILYWFGKPDVVQKVPPVDRSI